MKKKLIVILMSVLALALVLAACTKPKDTPEPPDTTVPHIEAVYALAQGEGYTGTLDELIEAFKGDSAYAVAVAHGYTGSEADWLMTLVGAKGDTGASGQNGADGQDGANGITPHIGNNGHWFVGETDTGVLAQGAKGDKGDTGATGQTGATGETGAKGDTGAPGQDGADGAKGDTGATGQTGAPGQDGLTPYIGANGHWWIGSSDTGIPAQGAAGQDGADGAKGDKGDTGTTGQTGATGAPGQDGVDGNDGQDGVDGTDGQPGANGLTPYIGTNGHWWIGETDTGIAAQGATGETGAKGDKGDTGATGQTGAAGTNGTNGQDGQNGQDGSSGQNGTNGLSAYEIYLLYHPAYTGTEAQWIDDLVNGRLAESDPYTEGLVFALSTDGLTYAITGYTGTATEVVIPGRYYGKQITSIASQAFYNCGGITSITIPASVTGIGEGAFSGCSGLAGITLPFVGASKTATGTSALFGYIFGTASYTGGTSTQQYYASNTSTTYYIPTALRTVVIASATKLEYGAFYGCSGLTSITIPASVTSIGSYAFSGCSGITSITIPDSVTSIGGGAFSGTAWYNAQPNGLVYAGKVAYKYKGTMPANTSITLLAGTKGIAGQAFYNCSGLTSITIPAGVTSIGESAFYYCSGLTSITIPAGVTSIGDIAFAYCSSLTVISYRGTEAEWNLIPKGILWNNNCPAVIVYDYED